MQDVLTKDTFVTDKVLQSQIVLLALKLLLHTCKLSHSVSSCTGRGPATAAVLLLKLLPFQAQRHYNIETIELHGRGKSYGFGIIDSKLGGVEVYDIKEGSVAERNGRLRPGDRLLQINEQNAEHMTCYQAALQLQASKSSVRLVIARVASDTQEEKLPYFSVVGLGFIDRLDSSETVTFQLPGA